MSSELVVTPTLNSIPIRHGDFTTTTEALAYAAGGEAGFNFFNVSGELTGVLDYKQMQAQSMRVALQLKQQGFSRHDRLIFIAETSPDFLLLFFACQYLGLIPCPIAFTVNLGGMPAYLEKLDRIIASSQAKAIISSQAIADAIGKSVSIPTLVYSDMVHQAQQLDRPELSALSPFTADEPAYIQFSSGSTTHPKGVQISQRDLHTNIYAVLRYGMKLRPEDRSFNWLPFHHNMGMIGFLLASVYGQRTVDCLSAENFVQNPLIWLELMSKYKTAITFAPVFGYQFAMKKYAESENKPSLDLSSLRVAGIGGDLISPDMLKMFSGCFASSGFNYQSFLPSYGLTETTLAVTTSDVDQPPVIDTLTSELIQKPIVSCGKALPGFEVKIIDGATQAKLSEREIGQIWVKGPSIITGYIDDQAPIESDNEGYIYTGDLGYLWQDQLFISGREKDVIIIRGRNIWAQDIEWSLLQAMPQIGVNNIAAISINQQQEERMAILFSASEELAADHNQLQQLATEIQNLTRKIAGVQARVLFTTQKLPLTSSGKLARAQAKEAYLSGNMVIIYDSEGHI